MSYDILFVGDIMETKIVNGVPQEMSLGLTQSAKGVFYIDKLVVFGCDEEALLKKLEVMLDGVTKILEKRNGEK